MAPKVEDTGKYTIEIGGVGCTAFLNVDDPDPVYSFLRPLKKKSEGYTLHECVLECVVSSHMAVIGWYKNDVKIEDGDTYSISKDMSGMCRCEIKSAVLGDSGKYVCRIEKQPENNTTETQLTIVEYPYKFTKNLKYMQLVEKDTLTLLCEIDDALGEVQWFKDGKEITKDKRVQITKDGRKRKCVIKDLKVTDQGMYSCTTNADKTEAEILVNCKLFF